MRRQPHNRRSGALAALALLGGATLTASLRDAPAPVATPSVPPLAALVSLGQLGGSDYVVIAVEREASTPLATGPPTGRLAASSETLFRPGVRLGTAQGPVEIVAEAALYQSADAAMAAFAAASSSWPAMTRVDGVVLGDAAAVSEQSGVMDDGTAALQVTVLFVVGRTVNAVLGRGRNGGMSAGEVVHVAALQAANETIGAVLG